MIRACDSDRLARYGWAYLALLCRLAQLYLVRTDGDTTHVPAWSGAGGYHVPWPGFHRRECEGGNFALALSVDRERHHERESCGCELGYSIRWPDVGPLEGEQWLRPRVGYGNRERDWSESVLAEFGHHYYVG